MKHLVTIRGNGTRFAVIKALITFLWNLPPDQDFDCLITKHKKTRTIRQNSAFHKYFSLLANTLNAAGLDMRKVLKESIDIPWSEKTVKDQLWRPIQVAYVDKESTTELETPEVSKVYEVLNKHLGEKFGIHVPFPSRDEQGGGND